MTFAWYGHLKYKHSPLWKAILVSWCIAFFEYCLQVPANRWGHERFSTAQLKILQEAITLLVFTAFVMFYMREGLRWNFVMAYVLIVLAVGFAFYPPQGSSAPSRLVTKSSERGGDLEISQTVDSTAAVR
jgi:uncharacterized protein (DUF486 family)